MTSGLTTHQNDMTIYGEIQYKTHLKRLTKKWTSETLKFRSKSYSSLHFSHWNSYLFHYYFYWHNNLPSNQILNVKEESSSSAPNSTSRSRYTIRRNDRTLLLFKFFREHNGRWLLPTFVVHSNMCRVFNSTRAPDEVQ